MASANGVPMMKLLSLSWLPPVMKTPVTSSRVAASSGSRASTLLSGRAATTDAAPRAVKTAW